MKALIIEKPHQAVIKNVPKPQAGPGEIVVEVKQAGICGTDFHIYEGDFISPYPIIPGHEFAGVVHEIGPDVRGLRQGDRVTCDPSLFCGSCKYCLTNRGNQCLQWGALGNTVDGCMAEYVCVPASNVVKMPASMSFSTGAFVEPLACVVHAMNRLALRAGENVLLFGAGAMGLQLVQALRHAGAATLTVVDLSEKKLALAKQLGATNTVLSHQLEALAMRDYDAVIDATGIPEVIEQAFDYMGAAAKYLQFGVTPVSAKVTVSPFKLYNKDWTLLGSMAVNRTFLHAFEWVNAGRFNFEPLISRTITLEEAAAFLSKPKDSDELKVQIQIN